MSSELWVEVLEHVHQTGASLASRYDLVCHLVTAADGADDFYTTSNNAARSESSDVAIELDRKTKDKWGAHPNFNVFENEPGKNFDDKICSLRDCVLEQVKRKIG